MNQVVPALASRPRALRSAVTALAIALMTVAHAAQTDISSTPILTTTAALVKPNVMLLMDTSGSMGRTHMPDEVETATRPHSIGYKSSQCNALYYNPAQIYLLPKDYLGAAFAEPSFTAAPYAGFGAYYEVPDLSTTNLESQFVAYDANTLETPSPFPDTPQAAYYYVYSGPETLNYATLPCRQLDTGATVATAGGGMWTKVNVSAQSADQRKNFAIWYSFYRTRIALVKSAASLAFSPLRDTKRVGFITVEPKTNPGDSGINPLRFLKLDDFGTAQKQRWFAKVFSQAASGASPAREGLARVGRYYGGKEDSINTNMPATGANDPVQYACQQNFTIMTTDGYWNGQTETPTGAGLYGGGLQLDGTTLVGQQDGNLSDPYSPRPIFDGTSTGTRTDIDENNAYTGGSCSIAGGFLKTTRQITQRTYVINKDTVKYPRHKVQYRASKSQWEAKTTRTTKTVTQTPETREQFALSRHHFTEEHYQHKKWTEQTTRVQDQYKLQTIQVQAKTQHTTKTQSHTWQTKVQWTAATSQFVITKTQYVLQQDQLRQKVEQVYKTQFQVIAHVGTEHGVPVGGTCTDGPGVVCETVIQFDRQLVDPDDCSAGIGPDPDYLRTTCEAGPLAQPEKAVTSCSVGVLHSGAPNYTKTTCTRTVGVAKAIDGTCVEGTSQTGGPDFIINICTLPPANNSYTPVDSCVPNSVSSGDPDYITTACIQPAATNQPATPSLPCTTNTDINKVTTTCVKAIDTSGWVGSCVADPGLAPPYIKVTCGTPVATTDFVPSASCVEGNSGPPENWQTTCTLSDAGDYPAWTAVQSCSEGSSTGAPYYYETHCRNESGPNNRTDFTTAAACGTVGTTLPTSDPWVTRICTHVLNNATDFTAPAGCTPNDGTAYPYLKVTCTKTEIIPQDPPTIVDPRLECTAFGTFVGPADDYIVTHCEKVAATSAPSATCVPGIGPAPDFIVTTCGDVTNVTPVAWCDTAAAPYSDGIDMVTCVKPAGVNNGTRNIVGPCVAATGTSPDFVTITCPTGSQTITTVDPLTCPEGRTIGAAPGVIVTDCSAAEVVSDWTAVASCSANWDGSVRTTCRQPVGPNNQPAQDSAPCTTSTDASFVTTTCTTVITDDYPITCSPLAQTGTGPEVTCGTPITTANVPSQTCVVGVSGGPTDYITTTACNTVSDTGFVDVASSCTPGSGVTPTWVHKECGDRLLAADVPDSGCVADSGATTGIKVACAPVTAGSGTTYTVKIVKTTTTSRMSGTAVLGTPTVVVDTGAPSPYNGGMCYVTPPTLPSKPPVDIVGCTDWPCSSSTPSVAAGSTNSLADVAQYYYKTDLRPSMSNDPGVPKAGPGVEDDNAPHQHMTTFALALGVSGTLQFRSDYRNLSTTTGDFAEIRAGTRDWPLWPDPALNYSIFTNYNNKKSIDDFWHAAVNGRGRYFSANDPTTVIEGLGDALAKIDDVLASGTADSVSTLQPTSGNHAAYSTSYVSGSWQGEIQARLLNLGTGMPIDPPVWSAQALLGPRQQATCDGRDIYLIRGGNALVNFTDNTVLCPGGSPASPVTNLNSTELGNFGFGAVSALSQWAFMTSAQKTAVQASGVLVNFIRGQRALEGFVIGDTAKLLRKRAGTAGDGTGILGDIVDSQPVFVGEPFANYLEHNYSGFKSANALRTPMLYVGANDGMLHAFYASVSDANGGKEAWAVIPSTLLPNLYKLADDNYKRDGHQFYVDGTPVAGDVWNGTEWRTILVGGLNAGGKGYYALDVTDPGALPTPKWEFKQDPGSCPSPAINVLPPNIKGDCNLGLSFGKPVITKLPDGRWVVLFTSGYNNVNGASSGDGQGFLYVVDALAGTLIHKIATNVGDADTPLGPSGLAQINNFVDNVVVDNTTRRVYGGDLLGNVWRFDFTSATATLLGTATDSSDNRQPITTRPELAELDGKPFVMVGTGKLLGSSDVTYTRRQSVYGFRDPLTGPYPIASPLRSILRPMAITQTGTLATATRTIGCSTTGAACDRSAGWVVDLAESGERINVEMKLVLGALVFASNVPVDEPCSVGGHSWFNQVDFRTGAPIPGAVTSEFLADSINVGFNVLQLPAATEGGNPSYTGLFRQGKAGNVNKTVTPPEPVPSGKRISWREITGQ